MYRNLSDRVDTSCQYFQLLAEDILVEGLWDAVLEVDGPLLRLL